MAREGLIKNPTAVQKTFRTLDIAAKGASPFYGIGTGLLYSHGLGQLGLEGAGNIVLASFFGLVSFEAAACLHLKKETIKGNDAVSERMLDFGRNLSNQYPKFVLESVVSIACAVPTFLLAKGAFDGYHAMPVFLDTVAAAGIGIVNGLGMGRAAYYSYT